jgi:hypothetical protein
VASRIARSVAAGHGIFVKDKCIVLFAAYGPVAGVEERQFPVIVWRQCRKRLGSGQNFTSRLMNQTWYLFYTSAARA